MNAQEAYTEEPETHYPTHYPTQKGWTDVQRRRTMASGRFTFLLRDDHLKHLPFLFFSRT